MTPEAIAPAAAGAGIPDLLRTVLAGPIGTTVGLTTVTYRLPRDFPSALRSDLPRSCGGPSGTITDSTCGIPHARPRALLYEVTRDSGSGRIETTRYDYENGRIRLGQPSTRSDLGFERIRRTNLQNSSYVDTYFIQQAPFAGRLRRVELRNHAGVLLNASSTTYSTQTPYTGISGIGPFFTEGEHYENGTLTRSMTTMYFWVTSTLALKSTRNTLVTTRTPGENVSDDHDIITRYFHEPEDFERWNIARSRGSISYRTDHGGTNLAVILSADRIEYGNAEHPWRVTRVLQLHLLSSEKKCIDYSDPLSVCAAELNATPSAGSWIATFQNPTFDEYGNLTSSEGVTTADLSTGDGFPQAVQRDLRFDVRGVAGRGDQCCRPYRGFRLFARRPGEIDDRSERSGDLLRL